MKPKKASDPMKDLHRLLDQQHFNSVEDINVFMQNLMGKPIPHIPEASKSNIHKAQDLVTEAYDLPYPAGKRMIQQALSLNPDCIEAYEFLAETEPIVKQAKTYLEKGIAIGRRLYGGEFLEQHKGQFWSIHETRPFMRCLHHYGMFLYGVGKPKTTIQIFEEMIGLNPNDNQGIRDTLLLLLLENNEDRKFKKYANLYKEDTMAFPSYTRALFSYKTEGESPRAKLRLQKAMRRNRFIPAMLLAPSPPHDLPESYSPGDEREAIYYAYSAHHIWRKVKGALPWLKTMLNANLPA
jgi:tetratricopeptide (TPR) repeat protein